MLFGSHLLGAISWPYLEVCWKDQLEHDSLVSHPAGPGPAPESVLVRALEHPTITDIEYLHSRVQPVESCTGEKCACSQHALTPSQEPGGS